LVDDVPPELSSDQHLAGGTLVTNPRSDLPGTPTLVGGKIGEVRTVSFSGMDDGELKLPHGRQNPLDGFDARSRQRDIIAHAVDVPAYATEVVLHIDDEQRRVSSMQSPIVRPTVRSALYGQRHG